MQLLRRSWPAATALFTAALAAGCGGDDLSVHGTLVRDGSPVPAPAGGAIQLTLNGPVYKHDFRVDTDGSFALADGATRLKPGAYQAVVTIIPAPVPAGPTGPPADRPPTPAERKKSYAPTQANPTIINVPGQVVVEPGRASGYVIEVPAR